MDNKEGNIKLKAGDLLTIIKTERVREDDFPIYGQTATEKRTLDKTGSINKMVVKEEPFEMICEDETFKVYLSNEWNVSLNDENQRMETDNKDDSQAYPLIKTEGTSQVDHLDICSRDTCSTMPEVTRCGMRKSVACQASFPEQNVKTETVHTPHVADILDETPHRYVSYQIESTEADGTNVLLAQHRTEMSYRLSNTATIDLKEADINDINVIPSNSLVRNSTRSDPGTKCRAETHTEEKPYKCTVCDFSCKKKRNLTEHIWTHTGEKPYKCSLCNYRCNHQSSLIPHFRIHTGEKPYRCSICEFRCIQKGALTLHLRTHTGEKPYKCTMCDYRCNNKFRLPIHLKTHTGEKPYKCTMCDYRCSEKSSLTRHSRTHTKERPFMCSMCDYGCSRKTHLIAHINRTHMKPQ